ncbi:hypothetical protein HOLleu_37258 [Holothuria leucospilota]|uniref:Uncharacterized protein n=1 Tax=Holothuria leucospilota TaxID=206669 RepID=A0A9Q0YGU4_HOLLE|nr:hypothetical protein HOLleu_37258 [Holothuria leucospilota]
MTSTTIEERVRLRMRGGPPWGFRVEGSGGGPVYISSKGKWRVYRDADNIYKYSLDRVAYTIYSVKEKERAAAIFTILCKNASSFRRNCTVTPEDSAVVIAHFTAVNWYALPHRLTCRGGRLFAALCQRDDYFHFGFTDCGN